MIYDVWAWSQWSFVLQSWTKNRSYVPLTVLTELLWCRAIFPYYCFEPHRSPG
ncbi:hypothetical protein BGW80DRAFT_1302014 [Lactifluus volemus]|nr:hypothetical protein BGW80DRAFT_1302014 [Lactifluus volemus]